jgi:hypothetical protein
MGRRSDGVPQDPGYVPYRPDQDKTLDNWEPYDVETVRSSDGFLFMGIVVAFLNGLMIYGLVQIAATGQWPVIGEVWWAFAAMIFVSWAVAMNYFKARWAERRHQMDHRPHTPQNGQTQP